MRIYAIAFLLEPYKDLIAEVIAKLSDPNGMQARFNFHMRSDQSENKKISITEKEAGELLEIASEYLYAKLIHLIFEPDLTGKMSSWFKAVCKILPDELDFSHVLGRFFASAVPLIDLFHNFSYEGPGFLHIT